MKIITSPELYPTRSELFIAGGISNCPNWQQDLIDGLEQVSGTAINPRRTGQFSLVGEQADFQISWEYFALRSVDTILFWFPCETLCPITLFELGAFSVRKDIKLIVGTHPDYARRFDVVKQLQLVRPEINVHDTLQDVIDEYITYRKDLDE